MSNKCPKCGAKLSPFYLKPNCPSCGVNIVQYGFDERLESDKIRAEKEWERFDNFLNGLKMSSIGSPIAIVRLISFFLPTVALLIPVYKVKGAGINLISIIKSIISDSASVFQNKGMVLCFISFAAVILTSLVCAVMSLFSYTKNGYKRNIIFSGIQICTFIALSAAAVINGASIFAGAAAVILLQILTLYLHKKHKKHLEENKNNEQ
ncbi:MAG: hypothetical protein PUG26_08370 [Oscillospiraceae bacterium]|nr:hypothetical protein [Oscillospiraceae bacterium]